MTRPRARSPGLARRTSTSDQLGVIIGLELPITASLERDEGSMELWGDLDHAGHGSGLVADDFDGDGYDDLAIGQCCGPTEGVFGGGYIHLSYGPVSCSLDAV